MLPWCEGEVQCGKVRLRYSLDMYGEGNERNYMFTYDSGIQLATIPESIIEGKRLGRHLEHDPRSRLFDAGADGEEKDLSNLTTQIEHVRHVPPFNQGNVGSCVGNTFAGIMMTDPFFGTIGSLFTERDAVRIYALATRIDEFKGFYPAEDTGSSGLAGAKACMYEGMISKYTHAFSFNTLLARLTERPVAWGIPWYDSFDQPSSDGTIKISPNAGVRGGHELELNRLDPANRRIGGPNSWDTDWGNGGYFWIGYDDATRLLSEGGDVTIPYL